MNNKCIIIKFTNISKRLHKDDTFFKLVYHKMCSHYYDGRILSHAIKNSENSFTVYLSGSKLPFSRMINELRSIYKGACERQCKLRDYNIILECRVINMFNRILKNKIFNIEFINNKNYGK